MDTFDPPIKSRKTEELLTIVGNPEGWNPSAVRLAKLELGNRKVPQIEIEAAASYSDFLKLEEKKELATEGFTIFDLLLRPFATLFLLTFSWEFKKDGLYKKARQQKYFRISLILLILISIGYTYVKNQLLN